MCYVTILTAYDQFRYLRPRFETVLTLFVRGCMRYIVEFGKVKNKQLKNNVFSSIFRWNKANIYNIFILFTNILMFTITVPQEDPLANFTTRHNILARLSANLLTCGESRPI